MKKLFSLLLVLTLVIALVSCGSSPATKNDPLETESTEQKPAEEVEKNDSASVSATEFVVPSGDYTLPTKNIGTEITTDVNAEKTYKLACIVKNSTNPYMVSQLEGFKKAGEDLGFEAIAMAPAKQDSVEEQVKIIEDMLQKDVDAIIIHCVDSNGIMPGIRKAEEAGVQVVTIGTPGAVPTLMRTGVDYEETGYEVAKYLANKVDGVGKVIILEGPPGAQNAKERLAGIERAFAEFPDMEIVASQTANFKRTEGMSVTENLIQKHSDINIIIGANDESALGAVQALKAAGMSNVLVGGFDGSKDASLSIESGEMTVSYNTDPFGSGYLAAVYLIENLNDGALPPSNFVPFPSAKDDPLITSKNVENYIENIAWWQE